MNHNQESIKIDCKLNHSDFYRLKERQRRELEEA